MQEALTQKQAAVLDFIRRRLDRGESPPTNQEICEEFGWRSTRSARDHLRALARKRYIDLPSGRGHRRVRLRDERMAVTYVPLVGRVVAGVPVGSAENLEGRVAVPAEWIGAGAHFALRVYGDSMKDAGVLEGDIVVVRKQAIAADGDVVVATLDGETMLKRLRSRGGEITLVPENRRYQAIRVRTESAEIHGVVVGLMRAFRSPSGWHYHRFAGPLDNQRRQEGRLHADGT